MEELIHKNIYDSVKENRKYARVLCAVTVLSTRGLAEHECL